MGDEPTSPPPSSPNKIPARRVYLEAAGKIVDSIHYAEEESGWQAFEIRFRDGTFLFIEPIPRVEFRMRHLTTTDGDIEILHDYGTLP